MFGFCAIKKATINKINELQYEGYLRQLSKNHNANNEKKAEKKKKKKKKQPYRWRRKW